MTKDLPYVMRSYEIVLSEVGLANTLTPVHRYNNLSSLFLNVLLLLNRTKDLIETVVLAYPY